MKKLGILIAFVAAAAVAAPSEKIVSTEWLQAHLAPGGITVVEIGDRSSFEKEHIPGARFVALSDIAVTRNGLPNELPEIDKLEKTLGAARLPDRGKVVIYAHDFVHAARGFFTLDYLGCAFDAVVLDGGKAKWLAEKRPVESGAPNAKATSFVACPHPNVVVNIGAMRKLVDQAQMNPDAVAIVDARPVAQFDGTEPGQDVKNGGHVVGAISVPWSDNLTSGATPVVRDAKDLAQIYNSAGVGEKAAVVVYCRTGMQAAVDYFGLRSLGREVYLYDGGYIEWNAADNAAIVKTLPPKS